jgi:hypothetical protein
METQGECRQIQRKVREYKRRNLYISDEYDAVNIATWDYFGAPEPLTGAGRFGNETFHIIWTLQLDTESLGNIENEDQIANMKKLFADRILKHKSTLQTIKKMKIHKLCRLIFEFSPGFEQRYFIDMLN